MHVSRFKQLHVKTGMKNIFLKNLLLFGELPRKLTFLEIFLKCLPKRKDVHAKDLFPKVRRTSKSFCDAIKKLFRVSFRLSHGRDYLLCVACWRRSEKIRTYGGNNLTVSIRLPLEAFVLCFCYSNRTHASKYNVSGSRLQDLLFLTPHFSNLSEETQVF